MQNTSLLGLPLIASGQAQKHVTHNEALVALDALTLLAVKDRHRTAPPDTPAEGDRHIVAAGASGAWSGKADQLAAFQNGGWVFYAPRAGWSAFVESEQLVRRWTGTIWSQSLAQLSVNGAAPDAVNRVAVASEAVLYTHAGAGVQVKVNKAEAGDTAAHLFQTGFSGRAEFGLLGNDDFGVKVSPDGSAWTTALNVDRTSGAVSFPQGASGPAGAFVAAGHSHAATAISDSTATGRSLITSADAAAARGALALGSAATENIGASGATVPRCNGVNVWSGQNSFAQGTLTANAPLTLTQTWNNAAVNFVALNVEVTNTASGSGSLLMNYTLNGASAFSISRAGFVNGLGGCVFANSLAVNPATGASVLFSAGVLGWSNAATVGAASTWDVGLARDGAGILAQRNGANAQASRVYNTGDAVNGEWFGIGFASNVARLEIGRNGTGAFRPFGIYTHGNAAPVAYVPQALLWEWAPGAYCRFAGRSGFDAPSTDRLRVLNAAANDAPLLQLGGTNNAFPALRRAGTAIQARLADDSGFGIFDGQLRAQGTAPASAGATGAAGDVRYDTDHIYVCVAANTWKRAALAAW